MEIHIPTKQEEAAKQIRIPPEVRQVMGWGEKDRLEIWVDPSDSKIVIKKHVPACICCGGRQGLKEYRQLYFCPDCRRKIVQI